MAVKAQTPFVVLPSAARTAAVDSADFTNRLYRGVRIFFDTTLDAAAASITPTIQGKTAQGDYYTLLTGAAIADVGNIQLIVHPDLTAVANVVAKLPLGTIWRVSIAVADADALTYSVYAEYLS